MRGLAVRCVMNLVHKRSVAGGDMCVYVSVCGDVYVRVCVHACACLVNF